jgi:hypothetical protein
MWCIYVTHMTETKEWLLYFLILFNQLNFVMEMTCIYFRVGTEL